MKSLLIAALITAVVAGAVVYNWPKSATESTEDLSVEKTDSEEEKQDDRLGFTLNDIGSESVSELKAAPMVTPDFDSVSEGDRLLQVGNFIGAYEVYLRLAKTSPSQAGPTLAIRLALASDQAGFVDNAAGHYRNVIESQHANQQLKAWAMLYMARLWHRQNRRAQALELISELFLSHGSAEYDADLRIEITHSLGALLQDRLLRKTSDQESEWNVYPLEYFRFGMKVDPVLVQAARATSAESNRASSVPVTVVQKPLLDATVILVDAKLSLHPMHQLLSDLREAIGMEILASEKSRAVMSGRSVQLDVAGMPVSVVLDQVLGPLNIVWGQDDETLSLMHMSEVPDDIKSQYYVGQVQRILRQLQLNATDKQVRSMALMHDGNNSLRMGKADRAREMYVASRDLVPNGELSAMLYFNMALLEQAERNDEVALNLFYGALDQSMLSRIKAASYSRIAHLELALGRPGKAIPAAARGRRMATDEQIASDNLMTLAKSYLMDADPFSANRVLFSHSDSLTEDAKRFGTVVSTHSRLEALRPSNELQIESERLVLALAALKPGDLKSFVDHLIVSRAYFGVGFRSKAIEHLDLAAKDCSSPYWSQQINLELAKNLFEAGQYAETKTTLASIGATPALSSGFQAQMLTLRLHFNRKEYNECVAACYRLLETEMTDDQKRSVLSMLGKSYQQMDQHYAAALCFAGLLPEAVGSPADQSSINSPSNP